ncbi:MAG: hypothetical protein O3C27_17795 [Actinomycetota bacterium]|nr:hypothetical protein [Actinomycetota bacterium]
MTLLRSETELIPVLDLRPLAEPTPDAIDHLGAELRRALEDVGFFFIVNHGVDWDEVEAIYEAARALHALPVDTLQTIAMSKEKGGYLGFGGGTSYASEIAGEIRTPNLNAAYFAHIGGYRQENQWPPLDGFRPLIEGYIGHALEIANRLLPVLASSLELPHDHFRSSFVDPSCTLRMSHYPVVDYGEHDWGLAPHTDSSIFTFLPANDVPGLEIRPAGHDWIVPPALAQSYLVNSGDMLKRWTNNRFRSTAHRARNASSRDRYAIPFFFGARDNAVIEALPTCVSPENPAKAEPITYGDYQRWFINRNYAKITGERANETAP